MIINNILIITSIFSFINKLYYIRHKKNICISYLTSILLQISLNKICEANVLAIFHMDADVQHQF